MSQKQAMKIILLFLLTVFNVSTTLGQIAEFFDDESSRDASFVKFKKDLIKSIEEKDSLALVSFFYDTLVTGRYACQMRPKPMHCLKEEFISTKAREDSEGELFGYFTNSLTQVLQFGFSYDSAAASSYLLDKNKVYFTSFPNKQEYNCIDDWSCGLIIGENVNLRDAPSITGKIIDQVSYIKTDDEILLGSEMKDPTSNIWWSPVSIKGRKLYVASKYLLWAAKITRIVVTKKNGTWKIIRYIEPDGC